MEIAPLRDGVTDLRWLMKNLGAEQVTSLLVEGGGEVNASFHFGGHAQRVAFFYAPKILGGRDARTMAWPMCGRRFRFETWSIAGWGRICC